MPSGVAAIGPSHQAASHATIDELVQRTRITPRDYWKVEPPFGMTGRSTVDARVNRGSSVTVLLNSRREPARSAAVDV